MRNVLLRLVWGSALVFSFALASDVFAACNSEIGEEFNISSEDGLLAYARDPAEDVSGGNVCIQEEVEFKIVVKNTLSVSGDHAELTCIWSGDVIGTNTAPAVVGADTVFTTEKTFDSTGEKNVTATITGRDWDHPTSICEITDSVSVTILKVDLEGFDAESGDAVPEELEDVDGTFILSNASAPPVVAKLKAHKPGVDGFTRKISFVNRSNIDVYSSAGTLINDTVVTIDGASQNADVEYLIVKKGTWSAGLSVMATMELSNTSSGTVVCDDKVKLVPEKILVTTDDLYYRRDSIFDVVIKVLPAPTSDKTLDLSLANGSETQVLGSRGVVRMIDFGYDVDSDGAIDADQTSVTITSTDAGSKTIKCCVNLVQNIQIMATDATSGLSGQSTTKQIYKVIRIYRTDYTARVNDFDQEISSSVNYWDDWNDSGRTFEPGVVVPKDLVKAMAYKESSFLPTNIDLMQVTGDAKDAMTGPAVDPRDWDWTAVPDASGHYPMPPHMSYSGVSDATEALSIKWGIRWLYAMKTGVNYADGYVLGPVSRDWLSATGAVFRYGDPNDINYVSGVKALYEKGKNPHSGDPTYLWPVKVDMSARQ